MIYETHVGTFTPEGTLDAAVERLPHLVDLGVDVVELLPLGSFPGQHNWGYDGVAPYSVHEAYGGPAALQRFVDAAHGARARRSASTSSTTTSGRTATTSARSGRTSPTSTRRPGARRLNLDGPDSDEVRRWVLDNVQRWLRDFHVDGLRLDAVHELHDDERAARAGGDGPRGRRRWPPRPAARCGWSRSPTATTRAR